VIEFVRRGIAERQELHKIAENLMDNCIAPSSDGGGFGCDNMTVIIVGLLHGKTKEQWYDMIAERVKNKDGPVAPKKFGIAFPVTHLIGSSLPGTRIQSVPELDKPERGFRGIIRRRRRRR